MDTRQPGPRFPVQFRVLVIGRANAGKTSILQSVCETTESPVVQRQQGRMIVEDVCGPAFFCRPETDLAANQVILDPTMEVGGDRTSLRVASKHRAREASTASTTNLCSPITRATFFMIHAELSRVAQWSSGFCKNLYDASVKRGSCEKNCMPSGLHSPAFTMTTTDSYIFRYCVPMDNQRPQLDLKFFKDICPDRNGASLRTPMTTYKALLCSSRRRGFHKI